MPNPLAVMQPGEQELFQMKRHPIGIFGAYAVASLIIVLLAVIAFAIIPGAVSSNTDASQLKMAGALIFLLLTFLIVTFVFIFNIVYWGNRWILTSDSITQVQQTSLFNKQSSQLSLANLEDVTVEQNGILTHIFNYGRIKAETAGERSKFVFVYAPNPNFYAQKILSAREVFEQGHHGGKQPPYGTTPVQNNNPQ
ncbi:MAG: hypothetical protein JWL89_489 [Candidatus Saccharibacteria bacterium]|nr:hypothetical protein [Candidatus Saccharibacteria bacterium]